MHRTAGIFVTAVFLLLPDVLFAQRSSALATAEHLDDLSTVPSITNCGSMSSAAQQSLQNLEHAIISPDTLVDLSTAQGADAANERMDTLQHNLELFEQLQAQLSLCAPATDGTPVERDVSAECSGPQLLNFQMSYRGHQGPKVLISQLPGGTAFYYETGMTIDADGAPNAYHPDNTGLDDLENAGAPGSWEGLAKDGEGEPFVQGPNDPFPGYYVSATALADRSKPISDPTRYVDASKIPFIVLPGWLAHQLGARPGDFSVVLNLRNGKGSYAIFADVGPAEHIGEGSVALAENLGIRSDARNGGTRGGIVYVVFAGSGNGRPRSMDEINGESEKLLRSWGGNSQSTSCGLP